MDAVEVLALKNEGRRRASPWRVNGVRGASPHNDDFRKG
jgi:hypothetical protein